MNALLVVTSLLWLTASALPAQYFQSIGSEPRRLTRASWLGLSGEQNLTIDYGQPKWRAEYEQVEQQADAAPLLLGAGALTTLRTDVDLAFGSTKVGRGRWYVAARRAAKDDWSLVLFASDRVDASGRTWNTILSTPPDLRVPVRLTRDRESVERLEITLTHNRQTPHDLELAMAWGPLRLRTELTAAFDTRQPPGAPEFARTEAGKGTRTASGLTYEVLQPGSGEPPREGDRMHVHYAAWLQDGTLFDSTFLHGEPVPLRMQWVVPGFAEALRRMPLGATFRLTLPPELAFGERGSGSSVPPNATLVYHVTLVGVDRD